MSQILNAIAHATRDLIRFKMIWIMIWPILLSILLWFFIGWLFWDTFSELIFLGFAEFGFREWMESQAPGWLAYGIQWLIHILFFIPLVIITTLIITAIFSMPALINHVAKKHYPNLKRESGGTVTGSVVNALYATFMYILIWIVTLPLWAFGAGIIVPFIAAAFLNQQLFRYDALSEHANHDEIKKLLASSRFPLWNLGLLTGFLQYIPVVNFFAPALTALAFIHYELGRLEKNRAQATPATAADDL
ncbi:MAG TPA: EI24 domain-containing protein [Nitrosomonas sp.]|uniref:EI24 domain-containing protein n=1 Tax=Nitrosomonas sp. TaxID=42353 RepID=UPI00208AA81F|nr:EI24 domain-containing protein [Nitrosomonas sp.]GJL75936.1 MAG: membrane protein [Nitrosomonas sp.]HNP25580.1 EI24 domain-containing protein [Nitrosomonas sp.]